MFGKWYQKTNKTEDTNKLTLLAFKIIVTLQAFEDGPDRGFRNVGQYKPDAGDTPKN
jgi:hypothetical protein